MKYFNVYNIDFSKLANLLTPPFLRKARLLDWLIVLLKPLEEVNRDFNAFRAVSIYQVTHNGQVFSLQAVLNDAYDNVERRIRIVDTLVLDPLYIYPEADERPVYVYPEGQQVGEIPYVYDESVFDDIDLDFLVLIPIEYRPADAQERNILEIQIRSLVNYYKLASKRYEIRYK